MAKLIPFNKAAAKKLGIVNTKNGPMIDRAKLTDNKKFVKLERKIEKKPKVSNEEKQKLEARGIY